MPQSAPVVLDAVAVAAHLPRLEVLDSPRELFGELAAGTAVQPSQSLMLFPGGKGDFIAYRGVLARRGVFGVKLSPYIATWGGRSNQQAALRSSSGRSSSDWKISPWPMRYCARPSQNI